MRRVHHLELGGQVLRVRLDTAHVCADAAPASVRRRRARLLAGPRFEPQSREAQWTPVELMVRMRLPSCWMNCAPTVALSLLLPLPLRPPPLAPPSGAGGAASSAKSAATNGDDEFCTKGKRGCCYSGGEGRGTATASRATCMTAERSGCSVSLFFSRKPGDAYVTSVPTMTAPGKREGQLLRRPSAAGPGL